MTPPPPRRTTTIRRRLLTNLFILVTLTGGGVVLVTWIAASRTASRLEELIIAPTAQRTAVELDRFFGDVGSLVLISGTWAERGQLDPIELDRLNALFMPILEEHPQVSSMMVADSDGVEYLLLRDPLEPTVWTNRLVKVEAWGGRVLNRHWDTETGEFREWYGELDYDPRSRVWFQNALQTSPARPIYWTEPLIFFITKDPGLTASTHVRLDDGRSMVVAFDLLLLDISRFTTGLQVGERGKAFVLAERAGQAGLQVVGLPRNAQRPNNTALREALMYVPADEAVADATARLPTAEEIGEAALVDSIQAWESDGRPRSPIRFASDGQTWLGGFRSHQLGDNTFWIGVVAPEADLLGSLQTQRTILIATVALILTVGITRAAILARRFSRPIEALVRESERIRDGDLDNPAPVTSPVLEFRRLAEAQEGMREGIKSRMKLEKVERDLDIAREIQRKLLPQALPVARGFDFAGWNQPADQTGGDFYDWVTLPSGRIVMTLADVTGHGVGPALIVAVYRAYLRASAAFGTARLGEAIGYINDFLYADTPSERFVTTAIGVLDPELNYMDLISAGHGPILFYQAATDTVSRWDATDLPLGVQPDLEFGPPMTIHFDPGDMLFLVTDGFFEWANDRGQSFGIPRLEAFVREHHDLPTEQIIPTLYRQVRQHVGTTPQNDDVTAVVVRRRALDDDERSRDEARERSVDLG